MIRLLVLLLILIIYVPNPTSATVAFEDYQQFEFAPSRGQTFTIPFRLEHTAVVAVAILTPDGDRIRTLGGQDALPAGPHTVTWDGKDKNGLVVPDEAYIPVLHVKRADGTTHMIDPRQSSGGEVVEDTNVEITSTKDIAYHLPAAARVLIRVGIKGGPMLRSLVNWEPRGPGKNVQRWNGLDQNGLVDIRQEKNLSLLVTAFLLPHHAIMTTGNTIIDYRTYRKHHQWSDPVVPPEEMQLSRGDVSIAREYYTPRSQYAEPRVTLVLLDEWPRSQTGLPLIQNGQSVKIRADIPKEDRWLMNESLYEVAFFIDHEFVAEEEQGYVPITWRWQAQALASGRHILTVNISGFSGKVGVASLLFELAK